MSDSVSWLLARGDEISIKCGRLVIQPASGRPVPSAWLKEHGGALIAEILSACSRCAFRYLKHGSGRYGDGHYQGVTLHLVNLLSGEEMCAVYNVKLTRERTTRAGRKGEPLPQGQFRVGERHELWRLWRAAELPMPRYRSELCEVLFRLGEILLEGERHQTQSSRLVASKVRPVNIDPGQVRAAFEIGNRRERIGNLSGKSREVVGRESGKRVGKEIEQRPEPSGFEADLNRECYESRKKQDVNKKASKRESFAFPPSSLSEQQDVNDWLADYSRRDAELLVAENLDPDPAKRLAVYLAEFRRLNSQEG